MSVMRSRHLTVVNKFTPQSLRFRNVLVKKKLLRMMHYSVSDTGILGNKSECSYQGSNLRPSDYLFGCSTTELQETRGN